MLGKEVHIHHVHDLKCIVEVIFDKLLGLWGKYSGHEAKDVSSIDRRGKTGILKAGEEIWQEEIDLEHVFGGYQ